MASKKEYQHIIIQSQEQDIEDIHIYYLPTIKMKIQNLSYFKGFKTLFRKLSPDILQINDFSFYMSWYAARLGKQSSCKIILCQGNYSLNNIKWKAFLENSFNILLGKRVLRATSKIGCKSYQAQKYLASYGAINSYLTPIGLDEEKILTNNYTNYKESLNLKDKKILLYVGVLTPRRNPLFLISLLNDLPNEYVLFIVGSGKLNKKAIQYAQQIHVDERCFFFNNVPQNQISSFYLCADLFLLASNYEIYGMVMLEALYFGLPVISTRTAGAETILRNTSIGVLTNGINRKEWIKHINHFLSKENFPELKQQCHKYIEENFLWNVTAKKFIQLYESDESSRIRK